MSPGSGGAVVGSTQTGAVRESGHGRGTPRGGHWTEQPGARSPFVLTFFLLFLSYQLFLPFQLSQIITLLFIYMNIYINKYRPLRLSSHSSDCYHCICFLILSLILKIIVITLIKAHTCIWHTLTLTHASVSSPVTVTPTHPHPPRPQLSHAQQKFHSAATLESK